MTRTIRRRIGAAIGALALAGLALAAPAHARAPEGRAPGPLLIGCNWPPNAPPAVEELLFDAGMNYARLTGGGYSWATPQHKAAADRLAARGVKVILQLGSHYPSADYFRFKEAHFIDHLGAGGVEDRGSWATTYSGAAWPQYSYAATELRPAFERDFTAYLGAFRSSRNVAGVILHNEPGLFWNDSRIFDYNPRTIAWFRTWLRGRYASLEALNKAWGSTWASFDDVEPPRQFPPVQSVGAWIDWRRAQSLVVREFLQWEIGFARRAWSGLPTTTNLPGPLDAWHLLRATDNYLFSEGFDFAGIDIYVDDWTAAHTTTYALDMTRGVAEERGFQVLECDVFDPKKFSRCSAADRAALMRSFVWTQIAHGARGILLWWGGGGHYELVTGGAWNERLGAVREVTHLAHMLQAGAFVPPPRAVAIVVDPDSILYYGASAKDRPYWLEKNARGWHAAVLAAGIEADILFADQVRAGRLAAYRAAVFAGQVVVDEELAARVTEFVRTGGTVVAESRFGEVDRTGGAHAPMPGCGLARVFGLAVTSTRAGEGSRIAWGGQSMAGDGFRSDVTLGTARAVGTAEGGGAGLTLNVFGRGRAIFVAARVGHAYANGNDSGLVRFAAEYLVPCVPAADVLEVAHAAKAFVDATLLADATGNSIVVVSTPPDGTKKPAAPADVIVTVAADRLKGIRMAYVFPPASVDGAWTSSGPRELSVPRGAAMPIPLGAVDSATVVLLAKNAPPVLGMRTPVSVQTLSAFEVTVTCHNPSDRPVTGRVLLDVTLARSIVPAEVEVAVPAWGHADATFTVTAGDRAGRAVVMPAIDAAVPVEGIPHDVDVQEKPAEKAD